MQSTVLPLRFSIIMVKLVNNSNSNKFIPFLFSIHFIFCCGFYTHKFIAATLICLETLLLLFQSKRTVVRVSFASSTPSQLAFYLFHLENNHNFIFNPCLLFTSICNWELVEEQCASKQLSIDINIIYCCSSIIPLINV